MNKKILMLVISIICIISLFLFIYRDVINICIRRGTVNCFPPVSPEDPNFKYCGSDPVRSFILNLCHANFVV